MHFCGGKLTLEQFHLSLSVLVDNVVRSPATPDAKPFLKVGIPSDFQMFHRAKAISGMSATVCSTTRGPSRFRASPRFVSRLAVDISNDMAACASEL
jgi:hypothetical protein